MDLKILQVNTGRCRAAHDLIYARRDIDLVIVSEPNKKLTVNNSFWFTDTNVDAAVGIMNRAIRVKELFKGQGYVAVELHEVTIFSCYISPNVHHTIFTNVWQEMTSKVKIVIGKGKKAIIAGDFNAKSALWGSPKEDLRGEEIAEWTLKENFAIMNDGSPTFERGSQRSHLDLTIISPGLAGKCLNWYVESEENLSLHKNITFSVQSLRPAIEAESGQTKWIINNKNRTRFEKDLRNGLNGLWGNFSAAAYEQIIIKCCKKHLGRSKSNNRKQVYWWNKNIADKRKSCNRKRRLLTRAHKRRDISRNELDRLHSEYTRERMEYRKEIEISKKEKWKQMLKEINEDPWGQGYKIATQKMAGNPKILLGKEEQDNVIRNLFPRCPKTPLPTIRVNKVVPFTTEELKAAIDRCKSKVSPGPDGLTTEILKSAYEINSNKMLTAINNLLNEGVFPNSWKKAEICLIKKPSTDGEAKFRPICLLGQLGKITERLIHFRLTEELQEKANLADWQYGFRSGRSTGDPLEKIMDRVATNLEKPYRQRKYIALITLDIKNAFNTVRWPILIEELQKREISDYLVKIICSYLSDRKIITKQGDEYEVQMGVPQGSILGPLLWNVYYDPVIREKMPQEVNILCYADDTALLVSAQTKELLEDKASTAIHVLKRAIAERKLQLAEEKTEVVILYGGRKVSELKISIEGHVIRSTRNLKYLGVIFDHNCQMKSHVRYVAQKAGKCIGALSRLMPRIDGPAQDKRQLYCHVAHSIILYEAPIWKNAIHTKKYLQILIREQRKMAIATIRAFRTVSTEALLAISGIPPIDLLVKEREYRKAKVLDKDEARAAINQVWKSRWEKDSGKAKWTKKLIKDLNTWINRDFGSVSYHMCQFLTGHGVFMTFTKKIGKQTEDKCVFCDEVDSPEHTLFDCHKWTSLRDEAFGKIGTPLTPDNLVETMLQSLDKWSIIDELMRKILVQKQLCLDA